MTIHFFGLLALFLGLLLLSVKPAGIYLHRLYAEAAPFKRLEALEAAIFRACGIKSEEMTWREYAWAFLIFHVVGVVFLYLLQRLQGALPLNPLGLDGVSPSSSFNTAVSFVTNTNWQGYAGEATMSYLTQMLGLAVQNFLSAAAGIAGAFALIRGFARQSAATIGNFWVDMYRITAYLLVPFSFLVAIFLVSQGVIQNLQPYQEVTTLEPTTYDEPKLDADGHAVIDSDGNAVTQPMSRAVQVLPMGPIASQEAIKELGTNGGGPFNANSAHPFENPNAWTNLIQMLAIFLLCAGLCYTFGKAVGDVRQGLAILAAMTVIFVVMASVSAYFEQSGVPSLADAGVNHTATDDQPGGNMEGKETRFGIAASSIFATVTTSASCGAVNGMHDSFTPLGGLVPLWLIQLGEVVFGGVGSGLYGMLIFAILAVFIAGLMIGRTPEYVGKKIQAYEMKMVSLAILISPLIILGGTALAVVIPSGKSSLWNPGAHGFSEALYAFSSATNNNGSAFAGLSANTDFYNGMLGLAMWFGRFTVVVPVLAIAGSLAAKKKLPTSPGTMPTHTPLFVSLLIGTVLLVGALTYLPALALGPVVDHLQMVAAK
jgi:K+-transporting ATPase ATPase A chain